MTVSAQAPNGQSLNGHTYTNGHGPSGSSSINGLPPKPIAICGMACRLPCGIKTPQELWEFLLAGNDARSQVPESRYNIEAFYDPSGKPGTTKTKHGYFLDEDLANLDTSFFSMPQKEVERLDPQQRLMLEVARECFEDAGQADWRGKKIGCYVGNLGEDWLEMMAQDTQNHGIYRLSGYGDSSLSNRISYEMNLQGPSMTIRTACSASTLALHEACVAIERGDCVSAIVGGTNLILRPFTTATMTEQGFLSPDGSSKTFSSLANGYGRGEAIVGVFVKPLEDALRDGNSIRAVIRATAINHDGKTAGFSLPSTDAQETLMRRAYDLAGLPVSETGYVECHGTGTAVGDPLETKAVARVFGDNGIVIGSTKPNFGHTEGASGILSLLKSVLALEHRTIPPSIKCSPRNPSIPWESGKLELTETPLDWPQGRAERISMNSFGMGGANAHVIIDSAASYNAPAEPQTETGAADPQLLLFSANTQRSLTILIDSYQNFIEEMPRDLHNIAFTLGRGREHLPYRAFAVADGQSFGSLSPINKPSQQEPKLAFVFTGQGAQWPQMGAELIQHNPTFRSSIRALDKYLKDTLGVEAPVWSLEKELLRPSKQSQVALAEFSQPLCTALQIALVDTLRALGIEATAVVGHSSGEIAAAYAAGALTAGEAIVVATHRGLVAGKVTKQGAMAAVGMSAVETREFLVPGTTLACENSPRSVTISGDADKIDAVVADIRAARPEALVRKLQVDKAYHSYHMTEVGDTYHSAIGNRLVPKSPQRLFFSSLESKLLDSSAKMDARYWQRNLESPVLFNGAVSALLDQFSGQDLVLLEVGPHSALAGPLTQIMSETGHSAKYVSTVVRKQDSVKSLFSTVGKLFSARVPIDCAAVFPSGFCLPDLPRYPFDHGDKKYWFESRLSKDYRQRKHPHHDLLGARTTESTSLEPAWRNVLHVGYGSTWLKDHKVGDDIVFPFAGYIGMAGEAVRQLTNIQHAFRLRHFSVETAMLLREDEPTEIITTFRPLRLTISQDSSWYEFTISAYNGHQWTKHCTGEVKAEPSAVQAGAAARDEAFPRVVPWERWFDNVRRGGLDLGPDFQNVDSITAATTTHASSGVVSSKKHPANPRSPYHIHPAVLDSALQLISVASSNGLPRKHKNYLPIFCEELFVSRTDDDFVMEAEMSSMGNGSTSSRTAGGRGFSNGLVVFEFSGLKVTPASITDDSVGKSDPHAASRLTWAPDFDFVDVQALLKCDKLRQEYSQALGELGQLAIFRAQKQLHELPAVESQRKEYRQWIENQQNPSLNDWDDAMLSQRVQELSQSLDNTPAAPAAQVLTEVLSSFDRLLSGSVASWESLVSLDTVSRFYDFMSAMDASAFFKILGHSKPTLRILELANWTKSPSSSALESLTLPGGHALWSEYTFASKGFVAPEDRLAGYPNLKYVTLDIAGDPSEQGFEGGPYDLVIANQALNATSSLALSLRNIKQLLAPGGCLLVQEFSSASKWVNVVLGTNATWWRGSLEDRGDESYLSEGRLIHELQAAGFSAPDTGVLGSDAEGSQINMVVVARPLVIEAPAKVPKAISLLVADKTKAYDLVEKALQDQDYEVTKITLKDVPPANIDIVSILDLEGPFFEDIADESYHDFQKFIANLQASGIFWITEPCHVGVTDPRYAQVIGLARVIRSELLIEFATCEVDHDEASLPRAIVALNKFRVRAGLEADGLSPEYEYAISRGVVNVGRYFPFVMMDGFFASPGMEAAYSERAKVAIGTPGQLNTLHWTRQPEPVGLGDHEVELEMHAVGINFKDILVGMNLLDPVGRYHGLEGAGVVRRVGAKVTDFQPGDRVAAQEHNMLSTLIVADEILCVKIPEWLSFVDAASLFTVYATVQRSFLKVGGLQPGDSVLIHSACGGVGLAAIQIAQMVGAEIYATVGSEEKAEYLVKNCHIPRNRIFHSRDASFFEGVHRETQGRGVTIVLNSLSGELLHESWKCVAPYGKLVEIGRRDHIGHGRLDMAPFTANRSYCFVDINDFFETDRPRMRELMNETIGYLEKGLIKPLPIAKEFDATQVADAFKHLLPGTHIGRVAVRIRDSDGQPTLRDDDVSSPPRTLQLDPAGSYLLVGGLGGLGRAVSTLMVEHGARSLVYLGRSAGQSDADQGFIAELASMGVSVVTVRGDITNLDDVAHAIKQAPCPLKGILQLTGVQADENFARLTKSQWDYSLGPKVNGTWNLHRAAASVDLDFFLLFSSMSAVIGMPGQANYAAGNSFLDAFVQYRHSLGLVCSSIDIGPVADAGFLADRAALLQTATLTGFKTLQEQELLDAVALSMMTSRPAGNTASTEHDSDSASSGGFPSFSDPSVFVLGLESSLPLDSPANRAVWKTDRRMAIYHNGGSSGGAASTASSDQLKTYIATARADPAILNGPEAADYFAGEIGRRLAGLLLKDEGDVNTSLGLTELGLDSLVAIELRSWWKQAFEFDISVLEMLSMGDLRALGAHAAGRLLQNFSNDG